MTSKKKVLLRRITNQDIEAALTYYANEAGLGISDKFLDALKHTINRVQTFPGIGSLRYAESLNLAGLRNMRMLDFPYQVFYIETDEIIDVWRVLHNHRDIPESFHQDPAFAEIELPPTN